MECYGIVRYCVVRLSAIQAKQIRNHLVRWPNVNHFRISLWKGLKFTSETGLPGLNHYILNIRHLDTNILLDGTLIIFVYQKHIIFIQQIYNIWLEFRRLTSSMLKTLQFNLIYLKKKFIFEKIRHHVSSPSLINNCVLCNCTFIAKSK